MFHGWFLFAASHAFQLFLFTIYKTKPEMYDAIKDPEKTCNGLFQAGMILPIGCNELAIIYVSLAAISGAFWFYYVYGSP